MQGLFEFRPSARRAALLDGEVCAGFCTSVEALLSALASQDALSPDCAARVAHSLRQGRLGPAATAAYASLVEAIYGDRPAEVLSSLAALVAAADAAQAPGMRFVTLDDADLGAGQAERYRALFDDDPASPLHILPLTRARLAAAGGLADEALLLLDRGVPELGAEVRTLIRQIIFTHSTAGDPDGIFDGASVFLLWGAVLLNADEQRSRLAMAEALAHETGHSLLSGFSRGAPLVENDPAERYGSPLRTDPRPMDGIVHATYVLARMHYCLLRLARSGVLSAEEQAIATSDLPARRRAFEAGLQVVDAHARLTEVGRRAFEPARAYMAGDQSRETSH